MRMESDGWRRGREGEGGKCMCVRCEMRQKCKFSFGAESNERLLVCVSIATLVPRPSQHPAFDYL